MRYLPEGRTFASSGVVREDVAGRHFVVGPTRFIDSQREADLGHERLRAFEILAREIRHPDFAGADGDPHRNHRKQEKGAEKCAGEEKQLADAHDSSKGHLDHVMVLQGPARFARRMGRSLRSR